MSLVRTGAWVTWETLLAMMDDNNTLWAHFQKVCTLCVRLFSHVEKLERENAQLKDMILHKQRQEKLCMVRLATIRKIVRALRGQHGMMTKRAKTTISDFLCALMPDPGRDGTLNTATYSTKISREEYIKLRDNYALICQYC